MSSASVTQSYTPISHTLQKTFVTTVIWQMEKPFPYCILRKFTHVSFNLWPPSSGEAAEPVQVCREEQVPQLGQHPRVPGDLPHIPASHQPQVPSRRPGDHLAMNIYSIQLWIENSLHVTIEKKCVRNVLFHPLASEAEKHRDIGWFLF